MSTDVWDKLMEINAKGVFLGIKYAVPEMRKVGGGSIVNISSISGFVGQNYTHMGYNASKGAVRILHQVRSCPVCEGRHTRKLCASRDHAPDANIGRHCQS